MCNPQGAIVPYLAENTSVKSLFNQAQSPGQTAQAPQPSIGQQVLSQGPSPTVASPNTVQQPAGGIGQAIKTLAPTSAGGFSPGAASGGGSAKVVG